MYLGDSTRLKDALVFVNNPPSSEATQRNQWPFTVVISAADTGDHYIDLYSQYSRSRPYQRPQNKWAHLLPQWRFVDMDGNVVDKIKTTDTRITDASGNVIGVTGRANFYYIDDMPSFDYSSPVMLWATMEVSGRPVSYDVQGTPLPGYANSKIIKGEPYYINGQPPTYLDISSNGILDIARLKWINNPFRYTIIAKSDWKQENCGDSLGDIIVFDYPQAAAKTWAKYHEIERDILTVPTSSETWSPLSAYFKRTDSETGFHIGGFQIGSTESSVVSLNTNITAEVGVQTYQWFRDIPYVWISNGNMRTINKVSVPWSYGSYTNPLLPSLQTFSYGPSGLGSLHYPVCSVSGTTYWMGSSLKQDVFGGIHGLAVGGFCNNLVWGVDAELDMLFNFSMSGEILTAIDVNPIGSSPQSIAIDSNLDMWVTLWGATSAIKFDSTGALLSSVAVPPWPILDQFPVSGNNPDGIRVRPVQVDTDTEDNIWVTYEHQLSSMLMKYDTNGTFITACNLPLSAQPQGVIVDPTDNSVWVSNTYDLISPPYSWSLACSAGSIQHYSSAGSLVETFSGIAHPGYLTLDFDQNLWFTFGIAGVGVISGSTVSQYWVRDDDVIEYGPAQIALDNANTGFNDEIKGLAVDGRNRVWALNGMENIAYVINSDNPLEHYNLPIIPQSAKKYYSIQGMGDWTGYHWMSKYYYGDTTTPLEYVISGISNQFNIDRFGDNYEIRRFNESWDTSSQMRDYALPEHINDKEILFETYFNAMVGGLSAGEESIGRKSYERIANFVQNHVDIDTCGIDQLYSLAQELDVPMDDYRVTYPVELKRLMDIISVSHQRLWGTRCRCRRNFKIGRTCTICGHSHCLNRSKAPISTNTYQITGGEKVVIRPYFGAENYDVLESPLSSGNLSVYAISSLPTLGWLTSADYNDYYFYRYIPTYCATQVEGVINWDDDYTTLSETTSSLSGWYGTNQLIDIILNYDLHQGLQFDD